MYGSIARICTSFIDVPGSIAVAVYFAGCSIRCPGCQNKHLWDRANGQLMSLEVVCSTIGQHPLADAIVFLGGEPTDQIDFLQGICTTMVNKKRVLYTGREFEWLPASLCNQLDMVVCGPYREEMHIDKWPASTNQRIFIKDQGSWNIQDI
jgi:anaerobic ribonucleoside-triphosphate reductase activating protein